MDRRKETDSNLAQYRDKIDRLDREIVRLILERAQAAHEIGRVKQSRNEPVYRPDREKNVYKNLEKYVTEARLAYNGPAPDFPLQAFKNIYREIMSGSIAIEGGPAVAFLGPPGSFSHLATRYRFGSSLREIPADTIPEIFTIVAAGKEAGYGVVPVDNTTGGTVGITLDSLLTSPLEIYAEHYINVHHNLMAYEDTEPEDIKKIYTVRIGMEQCRDWLSRHLNLKAVEIVETTSTAAAARMVAEKKDGAAIASDVAAEIYGLKILRRSIQDSQRNVTRFWIIGSVQCPPTGDDRTSIVLASRDSDEPGSLFRILAPFHREGINLTRIESRATRRTYGEYNFFIDFDGHRENENIARILKELEGVTSFLKVLGSYPRAELP